MLALVLAFMLVLVPVLLIALPPLHLWFLC